MSVENQLEAPQLLSVKEAAAWCRSSVNTLNHLRMHGRFAPAVRIGKVRFWLADDRSLIRLVELAQRRRRRSRQVRKALASLMTHVGSPPPTTD